MSPARENHGLEDRISDLWKMLSEASEKLGIVGEAHRGFRERLEEVEQAIEALTARVGKLEGDLSSCTPKIAEMEGQVSRLRAHARNPQWKKTGTAIGGLLAGLAVIVGIVAGLWPAIGWIIMWLFGP